MNRPNLTPLEGLNTMPPTVSITRQPDARGMLAHAGEMFAVDFPEGGTEMTVLHDEGLYRHLQFRGGPLQGFEIVTWPGVLAISLGHGTYVFRRETDMLAFFGRQKVVNIEYWAEKLPGGRESAKEYDEEIMLARLVRAYGEYGQMLPEIRASYATALEAYLTTPEEQRYPNNFRGPRQPVEPATVKQLREQVADARDSGELSYELGARDLLVGWERLGVVSDVIHLDLTTYSFHFLWSCHAVLWAVQQYLAARIPAGAATAAS